MGKNAHIGNRKIGDGFPVFIIAEAGSNHNRDFSMAKQLIDTATDAGADAVKFQLFKAERHYPQIEMDDGKKSRFQATREKELPREWIPELYQYCAGKNILFLCSIFYDEAVDLLNPYVEFYKIASSEMDHYPLIRQAWQTNKHVMISTGMAELSEVDELVHTLDSWGGGAGYSLMHCTVSYPSEFQDVNLRVVSAFKKRYNIPIGISDHTRDPLLVPVAAVALGANMIEKHFTLSNELPGPDHPYALEPEELKTMVKAVRDTQSLLGDEKKVVTEVEKGVRVFLRRTIFAVRNIAAGEAFTKENTDILRADEKGVAMIPAEYEKILGKTANRAIRAFELVQKTDIV